MKSFLVTSAALALGLTGCAKHPSLPLAQRPQIQGIWVLNAQESSRPEEERPPQEGFGRVRMGGRSGRGGGAGPGRMGGAGAQATETMRWASEHLRNISSRMEVSLTDTTVTIAYSDTTTLTLPTNGKERKLTWRRVGEMEARASWSEDGLEIERKLEGGVKIRETFSRAADSTRLIVQLQIDGAMRDLKFTRVYEAGKRAESGPAPAPPR